MKKHTEHRHPNRRTHHERRGEELGPPNGWRERRLSVERRLPVVQENIVSEAEWFRRLARFITKKRAMEKAELEALAITATKDLPPH